MPQSLCPKFYFKIYFYSELFNNYQFIGYFNIVGGKTVIYSSHRLSSCRFCDGELVQRGSHEELVSDKDGKYHELWNARA